MKPLVGNGPRDPQRVGPLNAMTKAIQMAKAITSELYLNLPISKTFPAIDGVLVCPDLVYPDLYNCWRIFT